MKLLTLAVGFALCLSAQCGTVVTYPTTEGDLYQFINDGFDDAIKESKTKMEDDIKNKVYNPKKKIWCQDKQTDKPGILSSSDYNLLDEYLVCFNPGIIHGSDKGEYRGRHFYVRAVVKHNNLRQPSATVIKGDKGNVGPGSVKTCKSCREDCHFDENGHIIAKRLGGLGNEQNVYSQNGDWNTYEWNEIEDIVYNHVNHPSTNKLAIMEFAFAYDNKNPTAIETASEYSLIPKESRRPHTVYYKFDLMDESSGTAVREQLIMGFFRNEDHSFAHIKTHSHTDPATGETATIYYADFTSKFISEGCKSFLPTPTVDPSKIKNAPIDDLKKKVADKLRDMKAFANPTPTERTLEHSSTSPLASKAKKYAYDITSGRTSYQHFYRDLGGSRVRYMEARIQPANVDKGQNIDKSVRDLVKRFRDQCVRDDAKHIISFRLGGKANAINTIVLDYELLNKKHDDLWGKQIQRVVEFLNGDPNLSPKMPTRYAIVEIAYEYDDAKHVPDPDVSTKTHPTHRPTEFFYRFQFYDKNDLKKIIAGEFKNVNINGAVGAVRGDVVPHKEDPTNTFEYHYIYTVPHETLMKQTCSV